MRYISTRGGTTTARFDDVLLTGLARDGGLFVPETWPRLSSDELRGLWGLPYHELAARVIRPFTIDHDGRSAIDDEGFKRIVEDAYSGFDHAAVAPLTQIDSSLWLLELFHGPTIAFKDYALQLLGRLFDHILSRRGQRIMVVGATSGDTGSAAIEACRDRDAVDIVILHPKGRVSEVQRRQMTTVPSANVHNVAIEGSFDDCQALVKAMFNDIAFRDEVSLAAVNSINWARIMAQIVYYVGAAVALGAPRRRVVFSVPTGNFGNVYAAYAAGAMGVPVENLIVGSNANDILDRFFKSGEMRVGRVVPTYSPSMDIQVSSNFERLLFDLHDRDPDALAACMANFGSEGRFAVTDDQLAQAQALFQSHRVDDAATLRSIEGTYRSTGILVDPHTAIGLAAARACAGDKSVPVVALGCAHPAKFPDAVHRATGVHPPLPPRLADLMTRPERVVTLRNELAEVQGFVRRVADTRGAAA